MKNKTLLYTVLALCAVAAITVLMDRDSGSKDERVGEFVFNAENTGKVAKIEISKGELAVTLFRDDANLWQVKEGEVTFPADGAKLVKLMDQLAKVKVRRVAAEGNEKYTSFGLDAATALSVSGEGFETVSLLLGEKRSSGGQYIVFKPNEDVLLVNETIDASPDFDNWELKQLIDIKGDLVKSIEVLGKGKKPTLVLSREKPEDELQVAGKNKSETERKSAVSSFAKSLEGFRFTKRLDTSNAEASAAMAKPQRVRFELFDGRKIVVAVGSVGKDDKEKWYASLDIDVTGASVGTVEQKESALLGDLMKSWHFEISSYVGKKFTKSKSDLVENSKS